MRTKFVVCMGIVLLGVAGAGAASENTAGSWANPVFVQGPHAKMTVLPGAAVQNVAEPNNNRSGLVTIFSSLATKYPKGVYWCCTGYNVMGANSGVGVQWMGGAFTPHANRTVTEIEVAAGYSGQGPNGVVISLNEDKDGVPGKALKSWNVKNLPTFGTCCVTVVEKDRNGIAVSAGKPYWVVLSTSSNESDTVDGWNVSDADQVDQADTASWDGSIWHPFQTAPGVAFAVRGN